MHGLIDQAQPITPTEATIARTAVDRLSTVAQSGNDITVHVEGVPNIDVPLPAKVVTMMLSILKAMAERTPVSIIPHEAELTTKQAADFLNVSRPFVIKLIDEGKLAARMVGTHRRIRFADLVEFEKVQRRRTDEAMRHFSATAKELGLDD
jgi:excisionase family DNA binding protein